MLRLLSKRGRELPTAELWLKAVTLKKIMLKAKYKVNHQMLQQLVVPETDMLTISFNF